jgi:ABC-type nitrate/sulfonate/bicarbonate transport system substrate-binding protein
MTAPQIDRLLSRRSVLLGTLRAGAGVSCAAFLGACGGEDATDDASSGSARRASRIEPVTVQHQWILDAALTGMYVAQNKGYYRDAGLSVRLLPGGPGVDPVLPVMSGDALVGIHTNASSVMLPFESGTPLQVFASQYKKSPLGFLGKASSGIEGVEDFKGRRIGAVQSSLSVVDAILRRHRLDGQAKVIVISPATSTQSLLNDDIDLLVGFRGNQGVQLELQGVSTVFFYCDDLGYRQESYPFFCSRETFEAKRQTLQRFLDSTRQGWTEAIKAPAAAAKVTVESEKTAGKLEAASGLLQESIRLMQADVTRQHGLFFMDRNTWEDTNRVLVESKLLRKEVDLDRLLTWQLFG